MKYLLSIDPGKSTGVALFSYDDDRPAELLKAWQFGGGVAGFLAWWWHRMSDQYQDHLVFWVDTPEVPRVRRANMTSISERFVPLTGNGFALTSDSVEPLRIEGAMIALGLMSADYSDNRWARPAQMYWVPGKNATEKRRNQVGWVKERFPELHITGKDVGAPDADDARSALWHGMVWLRKHHKPSAERWFGGD